MNGPKGFVCPERGRIGFAPRGHGGEQIKPLPVVVVVAVRPLGSRSETGRPIAYRDRSGGPLMLDPHGDQVARRRGQVQADGSRRDIALVRV